MMKVKLKSDAYPLGLDHGIEYDVMNYDNITERYLIKNRLGGTSTYHTSHFEIIDEPKIEVGSEWVWNDTNQELIVKCVGDSSVFYQWKEDKSEGCEEIEDFLREFTLKPKTVTMYFYHVGKDIFAGERVPKSYNILFTREIELP